MISILRSLVSESACVKLLQSRPTLGDTVHYCLPGYFVHEILQARILEWISMPSSRGSSQPRDRTQVSYISCSGRRVLYHYCHLGSPSYLLHHIICVLFLLINQTFLLILLTSHNDTFFLPLKFKVGDH